MKKNNKQMKFLALLLILMLLIGCAVGTTLAWLMYSPDPLLNTFTTGSVNITMQEHVLNPKTGKQVTPEAFTSVGNADIKMVPGRVIEKDPTVTVVAGSEECYVRVIMEVGWQPDADPLFSQYVYNSWIDFDPTQWQIIRIFDGSYYTNQKYVGKDIYELRYIGSDSDTVSAKNVAVDLPVFTQISVPANLNNKEVAALEDCYIKLTAQAIQKETFADAAEAWAAAGLPASVEIPVNP